MYHTSRLSEFFWSFFARLDFGGIILDRILNSAPPSWLVRSLALALTSVAGTLGHGRLGMVASFLSPRFDRKTHRET
jgi:predicted YcjX-like family ATPase